MWRTRCLAALAIAFAGCGGAATTNETHADVDPCALVTRGDASALLGGPVQIQSAPAGCVWTRVLPDHSSWSLRVEVTDGATQPAPVIIVTAAEITYQGVADPHMPRPTPKRSIAEPVNIGESRGFLVDSGSDGLSIVWAHADRWHMHLEIVSSNPSAAIDPLKQLARKVDAALPPPVRTI